MTKRIEELIARWRANPVVSADTRTDMEALIDAWGKQQESIDKLLRWMQWHHETIMELMTKKDKDE